MPGSLARAFRLPALPKRAGSSAAHRRLVVAAGVVTLSTAVAASVALASTPTTPKHHTTAAQRSADFPPSYTLPVGTLIADGKLGKPSLSGDTGAAGVPAGTAQPTVPNTQQVPAQSAAIATYQGGSGTLTPAGIATLALEAGCSSANAVTATAISMAESGGSPGAQGDIALMDGTWDWSAGLWQIRGLRSERNTGQLRDAVANQNAAKNAAAMYVISSHCTSWGPWSTFNNGAYERFLSIATQAVNYVVRYFDAHGHHYPTVAPPDPNAPVPSGGSGGGGQAQAAAPAGSARSSTHANAKAAGKGGKAGGGSSSTAAAAAGGGGGGGGSNGGGGGGSTGGGGGSNGGGGNGAAAPTPATSAGGAAGAASKVTKPVKSAVSSIVHKVTSPPIKTCTTALGVVLPC